LGPWLAQEGKGLAEEAAAEFRQAVTLSGDKPIYLAALAHAYAFVGVTGKSLSCYSIAELIRTKPVQLGPHHWPGRAKEDTQKSKPI
jgi:hypothetical protein